MRNAEIILENCRILLGQVLVVGEQLVTVTQQRLAIILSIVLIIAPIAGVPISKADRPLEDSKGSVQAASNNPITEADSQTISKYLSNSHTGYVLEPVKVNGEIYLIVNVVQSDDQSSSNVVYTGNLAVPPYRGTLAIAKAWDNEIDTTLVFERTDGGIELVSKDQSKLIQSVIRTKAAETWVTTSSGRPNLPKTWAKNFQESMLYEGSADVAFAWEKARSSVLKSEEDRYLAALQAMTTTGSKSIIPKETRERIKSASSATASASIAIDAAKKLDGQEYVIAGGRRIDSDLAQTALRKYADDIRYISNHAKSAGFAASLANLVLSIVEEKVYSDRKIEMLRTLQEYSQSHPSVSLDPDLNNAITKLRNQHENSDAKTRQAIVTWLQEEGIRVAEFSAKKLAPKFASWVVSHSQYASSVSSWATSGTSGYLLSGASTAAAAAGAAKLGWDAAGLVSGRGPTYKNLKQAEYSRLAMQDFKKIRNDIKSRYGSDLSGSSQYAKYQAAKQYQAAAFFTQRSLAEFYRREYATTQATFFDNIVNQGEKIYSFLFSKNTVDNEQELLREWTIGVQRKADKLRESSIDLILANYPKKIKNNAPTASLVLDPQQPTVNEEIQLDASVSKDPDGRIVEYQWDFDNDGTIDAKTTDPTITHTYTSAGSKTIQLTVRDSNGKTATSDTTFTVSTSSGQIKLSPGTWDIGQTLNSGTRSKEITITNEGNDQVTLSFSEGSGLELKNTPSSLGSGESRTFTINLDADQYDGGSIQITHGNKQTVLPIKADIVTDDELADTEDSPIEDEYIGCIFISDVYGDDLTLCDKTGRVWKDSAEVDEDHFGGLDSATLEISYRPGGPEKQSNPLEVYINNNHVGSLESPAPDSSADNDYVKKTLSVPIDYLESGDNDVRLETKGASSYDIEDDFDDTRLKYTYFEEPELNLETKNFDNVVRVGEIVRIPVIIENNGGRPAKNIKLGTTAPTDDNAIEVVKWPEGFDTDSSGNVDPKQTKVRYFEIKLKKETKATVSFGAISDTDDDEITVNLRPPNDSPTIDNTQVSPEKGGSGQSFDYSIVASDPEANTIDLALEIYDPSSSQWKTVGTRTKSSGSKATWSSSIFDVEDEGSTSKYRIKYSDGRGNSGTWGPFNGPSIKDGDTIGPSIADINYPDVAQQNQKITISTSVTDESGIKSVFLDYELPNGETNRIRMTKTSGKYQADIPPLSADISTISFHITAEDADDSPSKTVTSNRIINIRSNTAPNIESNISKFVGENKETTMAVKANDPDGDSLDYTWTQIDGPTVPLQNQSGAETQFTSPNVSKPRELTFLVKVSDGELSTTTTAKIKVQDSQKTNVRPSTQLSAEPSSILSGSTTTLDASASTDPDDNQLTYDWKLVSAPEDAAPSLPSGQKDDITLNIVGHYEFRVTVSDGSKSSSATTTVTVNSNKVAHDAFEDGDINEYSGDTNGFRVQQSVVKNGNWALKGQVQGGNNQEIHRSVGFSQPNRVQGYVRVGRGGGNEDAMIRYQSDSPDGAIPLSINLKMNSGNSGFGDTSGEEKLFVNEKEIMTNINYNEWYFVELEQIDWNSETIGEVYIDGTLQAEDISFRDSASSIDTLEIRVTDWGNEPAWFDDISIGSTSQRTPRYSLDVNLNNSNAKIKLNGQTFRRDISKHFEEGTEVTVEIVPPDGYTFNRWEGDYPSGTRSSQSFTITVDSNKTLSAYFAPQQIPPVVADQHPTDPDNDNIHEDLNGNDRFDFNDIVTYFNHMNDPAIANHVSAYDANGNNRIDFNDLVSLASEIGTDTASQTAAQESVNDTSNSIRTQASTPTVQLGDTEIQSGETGTVNLTLSEAPNGLSGYDVTLSIDNTDTGKITDATISDIFSLTDTQIDSTNTSITLTATDLDQNIQNGATGIRLGTLTVEGSSQGTSDVSVTVNQMDNDNGGAINPKTDAGTISVRTTVALDIFVNTSPVTVDKPVEFTVTRKDTGNTVAAKISIMNTTLTTGSDGKITHSFDTAGTFTATASKSDTTHITFVNSTVDIAVERLEQDQQRHSDGFEDGDLNDPTWKGDTDRFSISNKAKTGQKSLSASTQDAHITNDAFIPGSLTAGDTLSAWIYFDGDRPYVGWANKRGNPELSLRVSWDGPHQPGRVFVLKTDGQNSQYCGTPQHGNWYKVEFTWHPELSDQVARFYSSDGSLICKITPNSKVNNVINSTFVHLGVGGTTSYWDDISIAPSTTTPSNKKPKPAFSYSPTEPTTGEQVTFDASRSTDPDGTITSYEWDFNGDGTTDASGTQIQHIFQNTGEKDITLTVTDDSGKTNATTKTIVVVNPSSSGTLPGPIDFDDNLDTPELIENDQSWTQDDNARFYTWQEQSTEPSRGRPTTTLEETDLTEDYHANIGGNFIIQQSGGFGNFFSEFKFSTHAGKYPDAPYKPGSITARVGGNDKHSGFNGGLARISFQDSNGDEIVQFDFPHNDGSGNFQINGRVVESDRNNGLYKVVITQINWAANQFDVKIYRQTSTGYVSSPVFTREKMAFADDSASNFDIIRTHVAEAGHVYFDALNLSETNTEPDHPPSAAFNYTPAKPETGQQVTFDASSSTDLDGTISSYEWDFDGDGQIDAAGQLTTHTFTTGGNHALTLTVTDNNGQTNSTTQMIKVGSGGEGTNGTDALQLDISSGSTTPGSVATIELNVTNPGDTSVTSPFVKVTDHPSAWTISGHHDADAAFDRDPPTWIWVEMDAGESNQPTLSLNVPNGTDTGDYTVTAQAVGTDNNTITQSITITVSTGQSIDQAIAGSNGKIEIIELQQAIRYWANDEVVPNTNGKTIGIFKIQQLIRLWANDESINSN